MAVAEEDHLAAYKIKDLNDVPPSLNPVNVNNSFSSGSCELKKPQFLLVQSDKNGGDDPRGGPAGQFVCYKAKCVGPQPIVDANSQFGFHSLVGKKAKLLCLPVNYSSCTGQVVGGFCWYLGAEGSSCDATCAALGKTCDPAGTVSFAGSGGTAANCESVISALANPGSYTGNFPCADDFVPGVGCNFYIPNDTGMRCATPTTTCADSFPSTKRACACQ